MEAMRTLLRDSLAQSLRKFREEDRIACAWTIACGRALAERSSIVEFESGVIRVEVADTSWLRQFISMQAQLQSEISRIAEVKVEGIHFELKRN